MVGEKSLDFIRWSTQHQLRHYAQASGVWANKLTVPPQLSLPTHLSANLLYEITNLTLFYILWY